jgi:hypothetical protein
MVSPGPVVVVIDTVDVAVVGAVAVAVVVVVVDEDKEKRLAECTKNCWEDLRDRRVERMDGEKSAWSCWSRPQNWSNRRAMR